MKMMKRNAFTLVLKENEAALLDHLIGLDDEHPEIFWDRDSVLQVIADTLQDMEKEPVEVLFEDGYIEVPPEDMEGILRALNNMVAELPEDSVVSMPEL